VRPVSYPIGALRFRLRALRSRKIAYMTVTLPIEELTAAAFAPFGSIIEQPARASDASGSGWQWWGEMAQLGGGDRPYAIGYVDLQPVPLRVDWAERHMVSDELLAPLGGDCLVYVGPPTFEDEPGRLPDLTEFRVFRVRKGQAVLLKPGVWHGAPLAADGATHVLVILLFNTARQDLHLVRFEASPVEIVRS
jgi:ureidoglycolate lyase